MYYSLSNFNFQLLVPTMSSEGIFISAFRLVVVPQRSPLSLCLLVGFFFFFPTYLWNVWSRGWPRFPSRLQPRHCSKHSRHLGSPTGTQPGQSLQHPALQPSPAPACLHINRLTRFQGKEGAWKSLGTMPAHVDGMQRNTTANGTCHTAREVVPKVLGHNRRAQNWVSDVTVKGSQ